MKGLREAFGVAGAHDTLNREGHAAEVIESGVEKRLLAFALPLLDVSVIGLFVMLGIFFLPNTLITFAWPPHGLSAGFPLLGLTSIAMSGWLLALTVVRQAKLLGHLTTLTIPTSITALLVSCGLLPTASSVLLVGCVVLACTAWLAALSMAHSRDHGLNQGASAIETLSRALLLVLAIASCFSFDWSMRWIAIIAAITLWGDCLRKGKLQNRGDLWIALSLQTLLAAARLGGCHGWIPRGFSGIQSGAALSYTLLGCVFWIVVFEHRPGLALTKRVKDWRIFLHVLTGILMLGCLATASFDRLAMGLVVIAGTGLAMAHVKKGINSALTERDTRLSLRGAESHHREAFHLGFDEPDTSVDVGKAVERKKGVRSGELEIWLAIAVGLFVGLFLYLQKVVTLGVGISQFALLFLGVAAFGIVEIAKRYRIESALERPMNGVGNAMPALVAVLALAREFTSYLSGSTSLGALALMMAAGVYFYRSIATGRRLEAIGGMLIANLGLTFLWRSLGWLAPELYLVPIGFSIFALVEVLKDRIPSSAQNPLRYIAVLTMVASPLFEVIGGSWVHMLALMVMSVFVILIAIGFRLRALMSTGSACLLVDLVAMVIRSTIDHLNLLWIAGVVLGIAVIALAAFCENHRDKLLARIRVLSAELATWS